MSSAISSALPPPELYVNITISPPHHFRFNCIPNWKWKLICFWSIPGGRSAGNGSRAFVPLHTQPHSLSDHTHVPINTSLQGCKQEQLLSAQGLLAPSLSHPLADWHHSIFFFNKRFTKVTILVEINCWQTCRVKYIIKAVEIQMLNNGGLHQDVCGDQNNPASGFFI